MAATGLNVLARQVGQRCCGPAADAALGYDEAQDLTTDLELLGHPVRLRLLGVLAASAEPVCVCDLELAVPVKQPTVSHHLKLLRAAGLVTAEKRGLWVYYQLRRAELDLLRHRIAAALGRLSGGEDE
jgi:ArsR family transcriptional regulator, arsenate/arsenite/antimonite-responsive transcriptional repressor